MFTGFVRIIMILSFTRNAMGLQQMPPNQVLIGLALFLTVFVMLPVFQEITTEAYIPYVAEQIEIEEALDRGVQPLRRFMIDRTRTSDIGMFYAFAELEPPASEEELFNTPMHITIPAFLTSELRRAFEIGFFIYVPFLVIDMIVASTLMAMGMMMLPPTTISMPFKILLFVLVDGWALTFQTTLASFT
jgi:flagellar biosynthetic protein FliP